MALMFMIEMRIKLKDTFGSWMNGLGRMFRRKGEEASAEVAAMPPTGPQDEAEEALWQAMGWTAPADDERPATAVGRKLKEVWQ